MRFVSKKLTMHPSEVLDFEENINKLLHGHPLLEKCE